MNREQMIAWLTLEGWECFCYGRHYGVHRNGRGDFFATKPEGKWKLHFNRSYHTTYLLREGEDKPCDWPDDVKVLEHIIRELEK